MTETLKPCPFCGGVPDGNCFYADQGDKWGRVVCGCGAQGPEVRTSYDVSEDAPWHDDAIAEWNTRAAPREPGEAELRDAITSMTVLEDELDYPRVTATFCYGDEADEIEFTGTDALDCCRQFIAWYRAPRPDAGDGTGETT